MRDKSTMDYSQLAEAVDEMREAVRAVVAGLMADGFDETQARTITTGMFAAITNKGKSDE